MRKSYNYTEKKDTRSGFGAGLLELGRSNPQVVALCADLTGSLKMDAFQKEFPNRFYQTGIAEANMIGIAAGLATGGKIPFTGTFANFSTGRVYDQIRQSVAYSDKNVKICASHAGLTLGEDGATHQILEDIGMMRMLPNMTKAQVLQEGGDVTIIATGHLVWKALQASDMLFEKGIHATVINMHTIKPLDAETVIRSASTTGCVVTAEEHQCSGGLGEAIAQLLAAHHPVPIEWVAVNDTFGESGTPEQLLVKYGLDAPDILNKALKVIERKKGK